MMPIYIANSKEVQNEIEYAPLPSSTPSIEPADSSSSSYGATCGNQVLDLMEKHKKEIQSRMAKNLKGFHEMLEKTEKRKAQEGSSTNSSNYNVNQGSQGQAMSGGSSGTVSNNDKRISSHVAKVSIVPMTPASNRPENQETSPEIQEILSRPHNQVMMRSQNQIMRPPNPLVRPQNHEMHPQNQNSRPQYVESDQYMDIPNNYNARDDHYDPLFHAGKSSSENARPVPTGVPKQPVSATSSKRTGNNDHDDMIYEPDEASDVDDAYCCNNNQFATRVHFKLPDTAPAQQQGRYMSNNKTAEEPFDIEANLQGARQSPYLASQQEYGQTQDQGLHYRGSKAGHETDYDELSVSSSEEDIMDLGQKAGSKTVEKPTGQGFWSFIEDNLYLVIAVVSMVLGFGFWTIHSNVSGEGSIPLDNEYFGPVM